MKKYLLIYAVVITAALVCVYVRYNKETSRMLQNQKTLTMSTEHYRTKFGEEAASVQALRLRCAEYKQIMTEDADRIKQLGIKIHRMEAAAKTVTSTTVEITTTLRDTVIVRDTVKVFRWNDTWITVYGTITGDSVKCDVASVDTLRQIVHRIPRRFLFFRFGTKALRQEIISSNPHTKIIYSDYVKIEK